MIFKVEMLTTREVVYTTEIVANSFEHAQKIISLMKTENFSTKEDRWEKIDAIHINKA